MKKINFTVANESEGFLKAETRTTSVAPVDYVGDLYVTRFKMSKNCFPITFIPVPQREFSLAEKEIIDNKNETPLDFSFIVFSPRFSEDDTDKTFFHNGNTVSYVSKTKYAQNPVFATPMRYTYSSGGLPDVEPNVSYVITVHYTKPEPPRWSKTDNGTYRLQNEPLAVYSWNLENAHKYIWNTTASGTVLQATDLILHGDDYPVDINFIGSIAGNVQTSPVIAMSKNTLKILGLIAHPGQSRMWNNCFAASDWISPLTFDFYASYTTVFELFIPLLKADYNGNIQNFLTSTGAITYRTVSTSTEDGSFGVKPFDFRSNIDGRTYGGSGELIELVQVSHIPYDTSPDPEGIIGNTKIGEITSLTETISSSSAIPLDQSVLFKAELHVRPESYFPLNNILLCCYDLTFTPEIISVNTRELQGVTNPSMLPILKSFYIGVEGDERSDFVYTSDIRTAFSVAVNNPRTVRMTIKVFALTNTNKVIELELPPETSFNLQLTLI